MKLQKSLEGEVLALYFINMAIAEVRMKSPPTANDQANLARKRSKRSLALKENRYTVPGLERLRGLVLDWHRQSSSAVRVASLMIFARNSGCLIRDERADKTDPLFRRRGYLNRRINEIRIVARSSCLMRKTSSKIDFIEAFVVVYFFFRANFLNPSPLGLQRRLKRLMSCADGRRCLWIAL